MQNLPLVESCSTTDTSPCMSARDLAVEAGGMSLDGSDCNMNDRTNNEEISNPGVMQQSVPVVNSSSRSEGNSESSYCTSEPRGSWGDFEGFRESLGKSERFDHNPEISVKSTKTSEGDTDWNGGHCSTSAGHLCSEPSLHSVIQDISSSLNEVGVNSKPKTRNVCVTASYILRSISECLLYGG